MTVNNAQLARNFGSSYTTFRYNGANIAYLQGVRDSGQSFVAQAQAVQPLGNTYPAEIVAPRALGAGTIALSITELWHHEIWEQLAGLAGTTDLVQIVNRLASQGQAVSCTKIITPPTGAKYGKTYHGCVITDIQDGESFDITTITMPKQITLMYTHKTPL